MLFLNDAFSNEKTCSDAADEGCMRKILRAVVRPYYISGLFPYSYSGIMLVAQISFFPPEYNGLKPSYEIYI